MREPVKINKRWNLIQPPETSEAENFPVSMLRKSISGRHRPVRVAVCLFVLRFYGPVNPMGSCRARSVYLTTRLLGRLSPLSG